MPIDRTGVSTAALTASGALELLANVIEVSKPAQRDTWMAAARREAETLRRAAEDDVRAYNRYIESARVRRETPSPALRDVIEVPMRAARAAVTGIDLCSAVADSVKASVAADLGVAVELLAGAVRGIVLCVDANLRTGEDDAFREAVRNERRELEERANRGANAVSRLVGARRHDGR